MLVGRLDACAHALLVRKVEAMILTSRPVFSSSFRKQLRVLTAVQFGADAPFLLRPAVLILQLSP